MIEHLNIIEIITTIFLSIMASSGFWLFVTKKTEMRDCNRRLLLGLAHDRITTLATKHIETGVVTQDEYENLNEFLFKPYVEIGGNGTALRLMDEVKKLPIVKNPSHDQLRSSYNASR